MKLLIIFLVTVSPAFCYTEPRCMSCHVTGVNITEGDPPIFKNYWDSTCVYGRSNSHGRSDCSDANGLGACFATLRRNEATSTYEINRGCLHKPPKPVSKYPCTVPPFDCYCSKYNCNNISFACVLGNPEDRDKERCPTHLIPTGSITAGKTG